MALPGAQLREHPVPEVPYQTGNSLFEFAHWQRDRRVRNERVILRCYLKRRVRYVQPRLTCCEVFQERLQKEGESD